ncbi:uncharacterized protein MELLADRAFT_107612 [Melampsora larici-populina 98AG31]|uniref:Uncharacterized protein n=1 Tax=Melampsora larici-populina (strain 98AG31 / pathotype 3-4-7) TaxID=747676 RepID=F4RQ74_MELLP|nr:uncharacterized protein MELLADRAFT_107612 [Melampsora larici-populina 98AG31]EGG05454.1 hypothetical protein MELLADRAFT_107612 [Melampsora larici-populina 98AG31]
MCSSSFQRIVFFIFFYRSFITCKSISKRELKSPGKVLGEVFQYEWEPLSKSYEEDRSKIIKVPLQDLRDMDEKPNLKTHGFTWVSGRHFDNDAPLDSWYTRDQMRKTFQADSVDLVKELTQADFAVAYTDAYRADFGRETQRLIPTIHSDISPKGAKYFKKQFQEELSKSTDPTKVKFREHLKQGKDVVMYTVWRPLRTVEDNHLGLCSLNSLLEGDAMNFGKKIKSVDASNAFEAWKYREGQRWHYLSHQTPDEAFVFHGNVPHASFYLEGDADQTRMSYEATVMAIFESPSTEGMFSKLSRKITSLSLA